MPMPEKPTGVTALCVIALALGAMGFFGGGFNLAMLMLNPKTDPPVQNNSKLAELNVEFQKKIEAVAKESRPFQLMLVPVMMATSVLLAGAGAAGLRLQGRAFLQLAFGASFVVDAIGAVFGIMVQWKTMDIMRWYFKEVAATAKSSAGAETIIQVGLYTGVFFGVAWLVAKSAIYLWGLVYFSKRSVRDAFAGPAQPVIMP